MVYINNHEDYYALYTNVESDQAARENVKAAMHAILSTTINRAKTAFGDKISLDDAQKFFSLGGPYVALESFSLYFPKVLTKPVSY